MKNVSFAFIAIVALSLYSCAVKPAQGTKKTVSKSGATNLHVTIYKSQSSIIQTTV